MWSRVVKLARNALSIVIMLSISACGGGGGGSGGATGSTPAPNPLGTWKMTTANGVDVTSANSVLVVDASTYTFVTNNATVFGPACAEDGTWSISGTTLSTVPLAGSTCGSAAQTESIAVSGNTMTTTAVSGGVTTTTVYQKQSAVQVAGAALIGTWQMAALDNGGTVSALPAGYTLAFNSATTYSVSFPTCTEFGTWSITGTTLSFAPSVSSTCGSPASYTSPASFNMPYMTLAPSATQTQVWVQTSTAVPSTVPTGVGTSAGNGQVTVSWTAVTGATSYNVYYSTTSGVTPATGTKVASATAGATITGLTNGTTYYFVVTAVTAAGESAASAQATATPYDPMVPQNVTATRMTGFVRICLTDMSGGLAANWNVYRAAAPGVVIAPANKVTLAGIWMFTTPNTECNDDYSVVTGTTYYYRATSLTAGGVESTGSNEASVTY